MHETSLQARLEEAFAATGNGPSIEITRTGGLVASFEMADGRTLRVVSETVASCNTSPLLELGKWIVHDTRYHAQDRAEPAY